MTPDKGPSTNDFYWDPIQTSAPVLASPVVAGGTLFVGNTDGYSYAIDAQTGSEKWVVGLGTIHGTAAVDNGVVYVLDENAKFWGLDVTTGAPKAGWPKQLGNGDHDWSSPAIDNGNIFIADSVGQVWSWRAATGTLNWRTQLNGLNITPHFPISGANPDAMISVAGGKVFTGTHNFSNTSPTLIALNETSGNPIWSYDYYLKHNGVTGMVGCNGAAIADANPNQSGGEVYLGVYNFGSSEPTAICLDEATGTELWAANIGGNSTSTPAIHDSRVFIGSDDKRLYCLDALNQGDVLWSYLTGGMIWDSPAVADGKVYFGSLDHWVYCVNESDGSLVWKYDTSHSRVESSPAVVDGVCYIGNENGKIYAFGVPEPSTFTLFIVGGIGMLVYEWRRRRHWHSIL